MKVWADKLIALLKLNVTVPCMLGMRENIFSSRGWILMHPKMMKRMRPRKLKIRKNQILNDLGQKKKGKKETTRHMLLFIEMRTVGYTLLLEAYPDAEKVAWEAGFAGTICKFRYFYPSILEKL